MVGTLIKHEALRTRAWLAVVFGGATLLTLAGTLMEYTPWSIIQSFGLILTFVAVFAFLMVVQLGLAFDYWRSSYKKTGYFTQSLPVKGSTIYWSKFLWGSLVMVAALLWNIVLAVPALFGASHMFELGVTFARIREELASMFAQAPTWVWILVAILAFLLILGGLGQYYFAASIGSEARMNRLGIGGPILVYIVVYMVIQTALFLGIVAIPLGLGQAPDGGLTLLHQNFLTPMFSNQDPDGMPLGFLPVLFIVTAALIWRTVVSWNRKVSLA